MLDASHSGMEDVKKRVLEFLAVRKLSNSVSLVIFCFNAALDFKPGTDSDNWPDIVLLWTSRNWKDKHR